MPIYEYYCPVCHGRFNHLAKQVDAAPPPCPRCQNQAVERLISAARVLKGEAAHATRFDAAARQVDAEDPQAIADFLQASGRLDDVGGVYGSPAYRELLRRRSAGASEQELSDLVGDLTAEVERDPEVQATAARLLSDYLQASPQADNAAPAHEHDHTCDHEHEHPHPRHAEHLGWA